jgi:prepilin-type N-terminal cleavage/methylation domain-containing protein
MKSHHKRLATAKQSGFSLIEVLVVLLIMGIVSAALLTQINTVQQRSQTETARLDYIQQARDFTDQFFRDVSQIGYPNMRMVDSSVIAPALQNPPYNDARLAMGLVKIGDNELIFEGDSNGDGNVESVRYTLNGSGTCTLCLQRSQVNKVNGDPLTGQSAPVWGTTVNDLVSAGTAGINSTAVFRYFRSDGGQVSGLPIDISTAAGRLTLAQVKTIQISLTIQNTNVIDPKTGQPIEVSLDSEAAIHNCSLAAFGQASQSMSC